MGTLTRYAWLIPYPDPGQDNTRLILLQGTAARQPPTTKSNLVRQILVQHSDSGILPPAAVS